MLSIVKHDLAISTTYSHCHPERSMRIRFMNPHAQSKDPCTPPRASAVSGMRPWNPTLQKTKGGAEGHLTRARFAAVLRRIAMLPLLAKLTAGGKNANRIAGNP